MDQDSVATKDRTPVYFHADPDVYTEFQRLCAERDMSMAAGLRRLMKQEVSSATEEPTATD